MPTIIVEDGTGVDNANSYVDVTYLDAYATDRGLSLPSSTADKEIFLLKSMDYLEAMRSNFKGSKSVDTQALQWPRKDVTIDGIEVATTTIPEELKKAQCQLVVEQQLGTPLYPKPRTSSIEGLVSQKTVGPLTKKFAFTGQGIASAHAPIKIMSVQVFLEPLLSCFKNHLMTVRV